MTQKVAIFGPSKRFLSGVGYYTIRLCNALSEYVEVRAVLFRKMLPKRLFPGWRRVGEELTSLDFSERVEAHEILDWNNPITWIKAYRIAKKSDVIILQSLKSNLRSFINTFIAVDVLHF